MAGVPLAIPTNPQDLALAWKKYSAWFKKRGETLRPLWEHRITEAQEEDKELFQTQRSRLEIARAIADSSALDLQRLEAELTAMQVRTSIIVAAATLMFAVFVLKGSTDDGTLIAIGTSLLAISLLMTATSFIMAIRSLSPPFRRAWKDPYDKRVWWSLLVTNDFERYVMNSWLADRRTPIITAYKKAHSVAVPLLVWAAVLTIPGLAFVLLG